MLVYPGYFLFFSASHTSRRGEKETPVTSVSESVSQLIILLSPLVSNVVRRRKTVNPSVRCLLPLSFSEWYCLLERKGNTSGVSQWVSWSIDHHLALPFSEYYRPLKKNRESDCPLFTSSPSVIPPVEEKRKRRWRQSVSQLVDWTSSLSLFSD